MIRAQFIRLPPGGSPISRGALTRVFRVRNPGAVLRESLARRFVGSESTLHASGREALRVAFRHAAASSGRGEVAIPAYCCPSVPAAAVAAGLRVRLIDVDMKGRMNVDVLERTPLDNVAAVVIANLFGVPEPANEIFELAEKAGALLIDDAAQSLGASIGDATVGARGDIGILSFGRGKPLSALSGGASVWHGSPPEQAVAPVDEAPERWKALLRAAIYDAARIPLLLRALSSIPALGIGTTVYDPEFPRGSMSCAALTLAVAGLPDLEAANAARSKRANALARQLNGKTDFQPIVAETDTIAIYPRLAVIAPSAARRDAALAELSWLGATGMYPDPLQAIPRLVPHVVGETDCPVAAEFCARLLTLPTHAGLRRKHRNELLRILHSI